MGSSGEKRKGRRHLPKVGTPAEEQWERHEHLEEALHPFSDNPDRRRSPVATWVTVAIVVLVALIVIVGLIAFT